MNLAEFLTTLFGSVDQGVLEATFIAPPEIRLKPKTMVLWKPLPLGTLDNRMPRVHELNRMGYGCYFGLAVRKERKHPEWRINEKTGEKRFIQFPRGWSKDALYLTSFFVDVDAKDFGGDLDKALASVHKINPSLIVSSGGGFHAYLLLNQPLLITEDNRVSVKRTLKGLSKTIGADPHVAELARIFRMPETINTKPDRHHALCSVIDSNDRRYNYQDLYDEYTPFIPVTPTRTNQLFDADPDEIVRALSYIPPERISYDEWITVLAGLTHSLGENQAESLAERWSGWCSEPGEIGSKVASFGNDTGAQTATLGSVFFLARRYGYTRIQKPFFNGGAMSLSNKRQFTQNINHINHSFAT